MVGAILAGGAAQAKQKPITAEMQGHYQAATAIQAAIIYATGH